MEISKDLEDNKEKMKNFDHIECPFIRSAMEAQERERIREHRREIHYINRLKNDLKYGRKLKIKMNK